MLINNLTNSSPAQGEHRIPSVIVQISVHPVNVSMLVSTHYNYLIVAEWSNACPALKDCSDFKSSIYLWLLQAWVRIPSVVIFFLQPEADQDYELYVFYFLDSYTNAFMFLEQLASLSDDWSMLQKSSRFCSKKLNHLSILFKSYTDAVTSVIAITVFGVFLFLNNGKT